MDIRLPANFTPRFYQRPVMQYFDQGGRFASWVMHRRGGKDRTMLAQASKMAHRRVGLYWHCLPTLKQARKAVWDNITRDGKKLIDSTFPVEILAKPPNQTEMKLELKCGSIVQLVGADNFNALVGANPVHTTFSEWALTDPLGYDFVRPILRENQGSVAFITTPRGKNHAFRTHQVATRTAGAFAALMSINDTGVLTQADIDAERAEGMAEELIDQEYYCDWNAASVGSILGKRMTELRRRGHIADGEPSYDPELPVYVTSDIGFRDTAAFWFWQVRPDGFCLVDYDEGNGLDADDWGERLVERGIPIATLYLPHDAKVKTFQSKHSSIERMSKRFKCEIVPQSKKADQINAARRVLPSCFINETTCQRGIDALEAWHFKYDEDTKNFGAEPEHDWASHGSDAFAYGAQVLEPLVKTKPRIELPAEGANHAFTLQDLFSHQSSGRSRI